MELIESIKQRKSTRVFSSLPVVKQDIARVINAGIAAPSKGNSQIWEFVVVTEDKKIAMDEMLFDLLNTDFIPSMQLSESDHTATGVALQKAQQRSKRNEQEISEILSPLGQSFKNFMLEGTFTFFNAPVAILVFVDEVFTKDLPHILSVGAAVQNMLLAATAMGLGTCWIGGVWRYTKDIRALLGIPHNKRLLSSVALGYMELTSPINKYKSSREDISEFVTWVGFGE